MLDTSSRLSGPPPQALERVCFYHSAECPDTRPWRERGCHVHCPQAPVICRRSTTFKIGVGQTTEKHAIIQKTACEPGFAVFTKASAASSACLLAPPVAWQPPGHPTFLWRKTVTEWLTWKLNSPAQLSPSAGLCKGYRGKWTNWARTTQPTSNPAGSHKALQLYLFISTHQQLQACSLQFKWDTTNPTIPESQISLAYKAERVAGHLLLLSCHHPSMVNGGIQLSGCIWGGRTVRAV